MLTSGIWVKRGIAKEVPDKVMLFVDYVCSQASFVSISMHDSLCKIIYLAELSLHFDGSLFFLSSQSLWKPLT